MRLRLMFCVFLGLFSLPSFAAEFKQVDFDELVLNSPLYRNFDVESGQFEEDDGKYPTLEDYENRLQKMKDDYSSLNEKKSGLFEESMIDNIFGEKKEWNEIAEIDKQLDEKHSQIHELEELIENGGVLSSNYCEKYVANLVEDAKNNLNENVEDNCVIFNKYHWDIDDMKLPDFDNFKDGYGDFLVNGNNLSSLENYIKNVPQLGYFFKNTSNIILGGME